MKTNYNLLYLGLFGLLMFSSCTNDELANINSEKGTKFTIVATQGNFEAPQPESRTQIENWHDGNLDGTKKGVSIMWSPGDKIGVLCAGSDLRQFTYNGKQPSAKANFTGSFPWHDQIHKRTWGAYYPFNGSDNINSINANIATNFEYTGLTSISKSDLKAVKSEQRNMSGSTYTTEPFQQMATLLRFVVNRTEIETWLKSNKIQLDGSEKLTKIDFSCTNKKVFLTGDFTYDLNDNLAAGLIPNNNGTNKPINKLTINISTLTRETLHDGSAYDVVYGIVAPVTSTVKAKSKLSLSFNYGSHTIELKSIPLPEQGLKRGFVYNIGLNGRSLQNATIVGKSKPSGKTNGNEFANGGNVI